MPARDVQMDATAARAAVPRTAFQSTAVIVTAAHALSAGERSLSTTFKGVYPLEIMANTIPRSSAGSFILMPPAIFTYASHAPSATPQRFSRTASRP